MAVAPASEDLETWDRKLAEIGDPWLFVEPLVERRDEEGDA